MAELPQHIGPYEVVARLGSGGMAETYLGLRRGPGEFEQRVCLKRIRADLDRDEAFVRQFLDEARLAARLRHTNVVQVLDFGQDEQGYFLALELVEGLDLHALLATLEQRGRRLAPALVAWLARQLATALSFAHRAKLDEGVTGIVHRDISPSNVLVSAEGEIKLADFGIARPLEGPRQTASGIIKGKAPYMAPEYARTARFDARCDLFSLGIVLFECLAGRRPYDGHTDLETLEHATQGRHVPLQALAPQASSSLTNLVERLIRPRPDERPHSAGEVLEALLECEDTPRGSQMLAALVQSMRESESVEAPALQEMAEAATLPAHVVPHTAASAAPTRTSPLDANAGPPTDATPPPPASRAGARSRRIALALAATAALVASLAAGLWAVRSSSRSLAEATVDEPANHEPGSEEGQDVLSGAATRLNDASPSSAAAASPRSAYTRKGPRGKNLGRLTVIVVPFGHVAIDGEPQGLAPVTVSLPAGPHRVRVSGPDVQGRRTVAVEAGEQVRAVFK